MDGETLVEALGAKPLAGKEYDALRHDLVRLADATDNHEDASYTTTLGRQLRLFATMDKLIMDCSLLLLGDIDGLKARMDEAAQQLGLED